MKIETFDPTWFMESNTLRGVTSKFSGKVVTGGGVTIIGGGKLFHGAPIFSLKGASRIVGMVYFSTPKYHKGIADKIKASLSSFVWIPYEEIENYLAKSDAVLIGPGMMRSHIKEQGFACDSEGEKTKKVCVGFFEKYPDKKWVVDGGALQVVDVDKIPKGSVVTPNAKEFEMLFGQKLEKELDKRYQQVYEVAKKFELVVLTKDEVSVVSDGRRLVRIEGGNDGLIKGGVGDTIAGVIVGFLAKDDPIFSVAAASYLVKKAGEKLASKRGFMFNTDDLVDMVPEVYGDVLRINA